MPPMKEGTRRGFIFGTATVAAYGLLLVVQRVSMAAFADDQRSQGDTDSAPVRIIKFADNGARLGVITVAKVRKSKAEWMKQLSPLQYAVPRRAATEWAFSGALYDQHAAGLYRCIDCDNALFDSATKFDSGTGWPSFWKPLASENVHEKIDTSYGTVRREVICKLW